MLAIRRVVSFAAKQRRFVSVESIEKAVGRRAANQFIESMDLNSKHIVRLIFECFVLGLFCRHSSFLLQDTPLICVSDPAKANSWEWTTGLNT